MEPSSARDCLIRTMNLEETDRIPCCFMSFSILRHRFGENRFDSAIQESNMGLDPMLFIPAASRQERPQHPDLRGLPVRFHPEVRTEHWISQQDGIPVLHKKYTVPGGFLTAAVNLTNDWPHGNRIPFIDDYQIPRIIKPLVTCKEDLGVLKNFFLLPPAPTDIENFKNECIEARKFVTDHKMLLAGGWGVGLDMAFWLCGMQDLMIKMMVEPDFIKELLDILFEWNRKRMLVILSEGVDLFIRRAFYEGCDFVTPEFYREAVLPQLKKEAELVHQYNAKFGYFCTSGQLPMLDAYLDSGIDVLIGVDPIEGAHGTIDDLKMKIGHRICLWGGTSGAVTVERGSEEEIREAVRKAVRILGPKGFILSPVDNITIDTPQTWKNIGIFIDEWKKQSAK